MEAGDKALLIRVLRDGERADPGKKVLSAGYNRYSMGEIADAVERSEPFGQEFCDALESLAARMKEPVRCGIRRIYPQEKKL